MGYVNLREAQSLRWSILPTNLPSGSSVGEKEHYRRNALWLLYLRDTRGVSSVGRTPALQASPSHPQSAQDAQFQ